MTIFKKRLKWLTQIGAVFALMVMAPLAFAGNGDWGLRGGELQSMDEHQYGKVIVRMYSMNVMGTTSTFYWWRNGGHICGGSGSRWNELDIETIPKSNAYQSNPIWEDSNSDCTPTRSEQLHGNASLYGKWVEYKMEWSPNRIAWYHDGQLDREILSSNSSIPGKISEYMRYAFNLWTQGTANPGWLGNLDFNALQNKPVYQFVDYFKYYSWNGSGFNSSPSKTINFNNQSDITNNFHTSSWEFGESKQNVIWSPSSVGVVNLPGGGSALWLGLFHAGSERAPRGAEIPNSSNANSCSFSGGTTYAIKNINSGKYMDVAGARTANSTNVQQWGTSVSGDHRRFIARYRSAGWYALENVKSGRYLNIAGHDKSNNANLQIWGTNGTGSNEQFTLQAGANGCHLIPKHSNKCITVNGGSTANGANILQYSCNANSPQYWDFIPQ